MAILCQAALRALKEYIFSSKLVAECQEVLKRLTSRCKVTLLWVPGYSGTEENLASRFIIEALSECLEQKDITDPVSGILTEGALCMEDREIAQHILCECPATARIRLKHIKA
jgi:hypothetical protein